MSQKYKEAAAVLDSVLKGKGGLKTLTFSKKIKSKPITYALVCETLKYKSTLFNILNGCGLTTQSIGRNKALVLVMLYDFLFGQGIKGGGAIKRGIKKHEVELRKYVNKLVDEKKKAGDKSGSLLPDYIKKRPVFNRFARVNIIKCPDVPSLIKDLTVDYPTVHQDPLIPYVLTFPPNTDLHDHKLVQSGHLILQDKASCLPVHAIVEGISSNDESWCSKDSNPNHDPLDRKMPSFDVIDACAAPGNKTSQMASLIFDGSKPNGGNKVFAFDKSERRLNILKTRVENAGASNVIPILGDFLECDPKQKTYQNVKAIVLDPSCSGSGMIGTRLDHLVDEDKTDDKLDERLKRLSEFQVDCIKHAFTFPQVEYIVYSTCSIHQQENEMVVQEVLKSGNGEFELIKALPKWHRRGLPEFLESESLDSTIMSKDTLDCLVRVDYTTDDTNGFFVSLFKRKNTSGKRKHDEMTNRKKEKMKERRKRRRKQKAAEKKLLQS